MQSLQYTGAKLQIHAYLILSSDTDVRRVTRSLVPVTKNEEKRPETGPGPLGPGPLGPARAKFG